MKVKYNTDLYDKNTLKLKSTAQESCTIESIEDLTEINEKIRGSRFFILGGGSNILLPERYDGIALINEIKGDKKIIKKRDDIFIECFSGDNWDEFVGYCTENGYFGLENLSYIPGTVGAAPVQNISAYAVEVKDFIEYVNIYDFKKGKFETLKNSECQFEYRNSIFKSKDQFIVTSVGFKLFRVSKLNLNYKDIQEQINSGVNISTALELRKAIIDIRKKKLPDPNQTPNVGSFFHNPIIDNELANSIKQKHEKVPIYPTNTFGRVKLSAGWLIEQAGLKGFAKGNLKVSDNHALILTNPQGRATQKEVLDFAEHIINTVKNKFLIELHIEPIIIK